MAKKRKDRPSAGPAAPERAIDPAPGFSKLRLIAPADLARAAGLLVLTLIAYFPALNGGFLWDDDGHVTRPILRSLDGLRRIWFEIGATQQYYPLLHSAFWVEHAVWGDSTLGYHLANVCLHTAGALLLVAIVRRLELPGAWLAGTIFALHPVCVEAVAWISEQKSTLSGFFYLAAALFYLHFDQTRKRWQYIAATVLFVAALFSKTVTASLPAALLVIFWWQRGRIDAKRDGLPLLPWLAIGATAGLTTAWVEQRFIGAQGAGFSLSPVQHLLLAGRMICFYAGKVVLPVNLMFFYPHWTVDASLWWQYLFPAAVLIVAGVLAWCARGGSRAQRAPLAALLFFAGTLFPVLGFLNVYPFVYSYVADHFQYLATLGIIVPAAALLTRVDKAVGYRSLTVAALIAVLGTLTWRESRMYTNLETLYRESIARNPSSWIAHNNLANTLLDQPGKLPEAIAILKTTLQLKPDSAEAHNNLGSAYTRMKNRVPDSVAEYETALRLRPNFPHAHNNLGSALAKLPGRATEAEAHFRKAIELYPDLADAHNNLGSLLYKIPGRAAEAMAEYQTALRLDPDSAEARNNIATALSRTPGGQAEALIQFRAAVAGKPDSAEAQSNLGSLLSETGHVDEAIEHLRIALKLDPESAPAHSALGATLGKKGQTAEATAEYIKALELDPNSVDAHNNYGTLLAQQDTMEEATRQFEAALRLDPNSAEAHANMGNAIGDIPGRLPEALTHFETAVRIKPEFAGGHYYLGTAYMKIRGRMPDAIREFETAIRLDPGLAEAHQGLGLALAQDPARLAEALNHFDTALRLKPDPETQKLVDQLRHANR
jgi:tetratricopeptide (TPR) repeat protein